ncbi:MAG: hypothetical protein DMF85_13615 [Acidobacteria bacterium]|nr:MAG: hypothetical protein DMF85_13615 [Acidobacteriota bacterium]
MTERATPTWRLHPTVLLMATAHMVVDGYGNIYAPLLPLLIPKLNLTLAAAGTLTALYQLAASVAQVGFGHLADRWRPRVLVMAGPVVSILILSQIGAAAFHPPAAALAHRLGGARPGFAMSVHVTGGTLGFSLGPLLFGPVAAHFGLGATSLLALPGLLVLAFFLTRVPPIEVHTGNRGGLRALRPYARPLALLYLIVVLRTMTSLAFATFVPVMLTRRGSTVAEADAMVAGYLFASGIGGFFGGPAADRYGPRRVIALSLVLAAPFLVAAPLLSGWPFLAALAIGGMFLQSTLPVNVTFGQMLAPVSAATVSSLMMGFAWGTGGITALFVGMLADRIGIRDTLLGLACVPVLAAAVALALPSGRSLRMPSEQRFIVAETPEITE